MTSDLDAEISSHWQQQGLHWHCHSRELDFDPNHNYPAVTDADRVAKVARDPDEVADWMIGEERAADDRASDKWRHARGPRLEDDGAGLSFHRRTVAVGKPTASMIRLSDHRVVLLDALPASGCH